MNFNPSRRGLCMESFSNLLVIIFGVGSCGAAIAFLLTLVDYVHTLKATRQSEQQPNSESSS